MSFTSLRYHVTTATKYRRPFITEEVEPLLFRDIRDKAETLGGKVFAINGVEDHIHLVVSIPASIAVDHFVGQLKATATRLVRKRGHEFEWQVGYSAFTVSAFEMDDLLEYVRRQKEHHAKGTIRQALEVESDSPLENPLSPPR